MSCSRITIPLCAHKAVYDFLCVYCGEVSPEWFRFSQASDDSIDSWPVCSICHRPARTCLTSEADAPHDYEPTRAPSGERIVAIVCGDRRPTPRCYHCHGLSDRLCDGPPRERRKKTYSRNVCVECATSPHPDVDYCRDCAAYRHAGAQVRMLAL